MAEKEVNDAASGGGGWWARFWSFVMHPVTSAVVIVIVFLAIVAAILAAAKRPIIEQLPDLGFARGIITLMFVLFTVGFAAIVLIHGLFVSDAREDDRRFTRGREVLGLFIGIVGTIIGFYFGSSEKGPTTFDVAVRAERETESGTISINAHAVGGSPPYRFSILAGAVKTSEQPIKSDDGWVSTRVEGDHAGEVTVEAIDAKDLRASKTVTIQVPPIRGPTTAEQKPPTGPRPETGGTQPKTNANANSAPK